MRIENSKKKARVQITTTTTIISSHELKLMIGFWKFQTDEKTTFTKRVIISFSFAQDLIDDQQWSCVNETLWWTSREWKNHCPNTENIWQGLRFDDWNIISKTPRQENLSDRTGQVLTKVYHPKPTPKLNSPELGLPSLSK